MNLTSETLKPFVSAIAYGCSRKATSKSILRDIGYTCWHGTYRTIYFCWLTSRAPFDLPARTPAVNARSCLSLILPVDPFQDDRMRRRQQSPSGASFPALEYHATNLHKVLETCYSALHRQLSFHIRQEGSFWDTLDSSTCIRRRGCPSCRRSEHQGIL